MSEKRYPWAEAQKVAEQIIEALRPYCERIEIAGSLRRLKPDVGDIEILYIPVLREQPDNTDLFRTIEANLADDRIQDLERANVLGRRLNKEGRTTYGPKNKLMVHIPSGIPVDLFAATEENWFNYLVCRTGPADLNVEICKAAIARGFNWKPYGSGFESRNGVMHETGSEREVFDFVGLPYLEPEKRR